MPRQLEPLDARIPSWERDHFGERPCPFCQSEGSDRYIRPDGLHVCSCSTCGCYFISPSPSAADLAKFYATYYVDHRGSEYQQYKDPVLVGEMFALDPHSDIKARTLASLLHLKGKRALDVGCGMGQNLLFMKKLGADVTVIDLDHDSVEFTRNVLGIQSVHRQDIHALPDLESYDVIMLHDVIEHPLDPLAVLQKSKVLLARGGLLSIWTPNASAVEAEEQPVAFRVDLEHMQYLTFQTCRQIADRLRMTIVYLEAQGRSKLKSIQNMSAQTKKRTTKRFLRGLFRSFPGFVQLNAMRKRLVSRYDQSGNYHLFCVLRNEMRA
jgi:2-polyprenyl-3-methyl-5-hydroxy-6-metoxy-1,4-benzoquinol methylase